MKKHESFTPKQRKIISILSVLALILFFAAAYLLFGKKMLALASDSDAFCAWITERGFGGKLAFIGMMIFQVVVAVIPSEPLEIGAGYAFGAWGGALLCMIGIMAGSTIVFFFVKKLGVKAVEVFFSLEKINSLSFMKNHKRLYMLTFLLYFIPGTPKDLVTYVSGLTEINFGVWLLISSVARFLSVVTSTVGGAAIQGKQYVYAAIVFGITAIISLIGILLYRRLCARKKTEDKPEKSECDELPK